MIQRNKLFLVHRLEQVQMLSAEGLDTLQKWLQNLENGVDSEARRPKQHWIIKENKI